MSGENAVSPYAIAVKLAYDGAPFCGFARQPELDTVQGRLESALATVLRREVMTTGAGRTDSGVHALGQVVSLDAKGDEPEPDSLRRSLSALSGEGISIREVRLARPGFSARFDAVAREYRYRIVSGPVEPLFLSRFAWHVPTTLDVEAMASSARALVGEHDFHSFTVADSVEGRSTKRRIETLEVVRESQLGEECVMVRVVGNAFLHSMVRVIVGSLVEIGVGRREADWLEAALAARMRTAAGPTAPAHGLVLHAVSYPDAVWL